MKYLLAHDLGTSGNKATLFSENGELITSRVESYGCHYFNGNWAEEDPEDWWRAVVVTTRGILEEINPADVAAVSFSGQMQGCLCVGKDGMPLRPSIIWADQRSERETEQIRKVLPDEEYYMETGNRNSSTYTPQKLLWVKNNEPDIYAKTWKVMNAKDYMVFRLTGTAATEYSDAGCAGALEMSRLRWSVKVMDAAGLDIEKFPELISSTAVAGGVTPEASRLTGLVEGTPVVMGGGDGGCAAIGAGCVEDGKIYCILGSSSWIASQDPEPYLDSEKKLFSIPSLVPGKYDICGSMQAAGLSYSWMKDTLCGEETRLAKSGGMNVYDMIDECIKSSPAGANGLLFLPYLLGERCPRWDPDAKGAFIGLTKEHGRADMMRAVVEGVSLNLGVIMDIFRRKRDYSEMTVIGGGMKSAVWRRIMADVLDVDILVPKRLEEATSMGAAVAAGVGVGMFKDFRAVYKFTGTESVTKPDRANAGRYAEAKEIFNACYDALAPVFKMM